MKTATKKKPAAIKTASVASLTPPKVGEYWPGQGGLFTGLLLNDTGEEEYLVTYNGVYKGEANQADLIKWASKLSADGHKDFTLPETYESPIMFAILKKTLFKAAGWYWTKTPYADGSSYAWYQSFNDGGQYTCHKDFKLRGCAVRRIKKI